MGHQRFLPNGGLVGPARMCCRSSLLVYGTLVQCQSLHGVERWEIAVVPRIFWNTIDDDDAWDDGVGTKFTAEVVQPGRRPM